VPWRGPRREFLLSQLVFEDLLELAFLPHLLQRTILLSRQLRLDGDAGWLKTRLIIIPPSGA
jgi:hypothetical protein